MKGLVKQEDFKGAVQGKLTTKMVRDWRRKLYVCDGQSRERWMRRSRLVARECAVDKPDPTYSPATGAHTANLLPDLFSHKQAEAEGMGDGYAPALCSLDIKDAFLQVPQKDPIQVDLHSISYVILMPGQRQGSREWYWHFRQFPSDELGFEWCDVQPCLAKTKDAVVLLHVDDVLFLRQQQFLPQRVPQEVPEQVNRKLKFVGKGWSKYQLSEEENGESPRWHTLVGPWHEN